MADGHATTTSAATGLVRRDDVIDRIERLRSMALLRPGSKIRQESYTDALDDLLDAFHGFCHNDFAIQEVDR